MARYGSKRRFTQYCEVRAQLLTSQGVVDPGKGCRALVDDLLVLNNELNQKMSRMEAEKTDTDLEIMKGQETLVELLDSLESFIQEEVAVTTKEGNMSLVISDMKKIEAFTAAVTGIKNAISKNIEILAKAYSIQ